MKFFCILVPAIFLPLFLSAQGNYKQGFVINLKGDTLRGYIDLREWGSNPTNINFKVSADKSTPQSFTVNDISYFEIPKIVAYKQFVTSISLDETNIQRIPDHRDTSSKTDNVFLRVREHGLNVTLYSYQDQLKERFYIFDNKSGKIAELIYRIYFVPNDNNNVSTASQNAYKQQLLLIAQQFSTYNDNLKALIEEAAYEGGDLVAICRKINNDHEQINNSEKKALRFFVSAGASFATTNLTGSLPLYNAAKSTSSVAPRISTGVNFYPNPEVEKTALRMEISYTSTTYKTTGNLSYL
jgi:hypothetical protein